MFVLIVFFTLSVSLAWKFKSLKPCNIRDPYTMRECVNLNCRFHVYTNEEWLYQYHLYGEW